MSTVWQITVHVQVATRYRLEGFAKLLIKLKFSPLSDKRWFLEAGKCSLCEIPNMQKRNLLVIVSYEICQRNVAISDNQLKLIAYFSLVSFSEMIIV